MTRSNPSGLDYQFRPASYFDNLNAATVVLASILGEERRKDVQARLASGDFDPLVWGDWLTDSRLDESTRTLIGGFHPAFMGGEYLPKLAEEEIEIARVVLASTTQDVISIRAQRRGKRIYYRVVDEYETDYKLKPGWSLKPLTLRQLISLIDGAEADEVTGLVYPVIDMNCAGGAEPDSLHHFVSVKSNFYAYVSTYYDRTTEEYLAKLFPEDTEE
jgi:hypothetical protein